MAEIKSRTGNITKNVTVVLITQFLSLLFAFANRTIFIHLLGEEYLGLDGLFTSILTIFSLAELGIGNALVFSLYKPIASNDTFKIQQLLTLYEKAYRLIIYSILAIGLLIIPFIKNIVNTDLNNLGINIYVVYILFLLNTISSYFLAHRQAVFVINQEQRVVSLYQTCGKLIVYALECASLILFSSYYLFLLLRVIGNYIIALLLCFKAKQLYPDLCCRNEKKLPSDEINKIKKDVYALFLRRVGGVVLTSTDNIVINSFISLGMVGIYSNYVLIVTSIQAITTQVMSAMTASIGNYVATQNKEETENAFKLYTFITYLVYGFCSICFILLTNRFIQLLWGESYLLSKTVLYLIVLNFFFYGFQSAINVFRDTTGLFVQGKYRNIISAFVNVATSIILVQHLGIVGVILGTIISRVFVSAWYDPYILYKYYFKCNFLHYFLRFFIYLVATFVIASLLDYATNRIGNDVSDFIICILVATFSFIFVFLPFVKTSESKDLITRVRSIIHN